ncbi:MAG: hypothetical protein J6P84_00330 [Alphaproteobacteria bacterium]|nr:hypothetical protein [Alphaproteobacteria bacterium]
MKLLLIFFKIHKHTFDVGVSFWCERSATLSAPTILKKISMALKLANTASVSLINCQFSLKKQLIISSPTLSAAGSGDTLL